MRLQSLRLNSNFDSKKRFGTNGKDLKHFTTSRHWLAFQVRINGARTGVRIYFMLKPMPRHGIKPEKTYELDSKAPNFTTQGFDLRLIDISSDQKFAKSAL